MEIPAVTCNLHPHTDNPPQKPPSISIYPPPRSSLIPRLSSSFDHSRSFHPVSTPHPTSIELWSALPNFNQANHCGTCAKDVLDGTPQVNYRTKATNPKLNSSLHTHLQCLQFDIIPGAYSFTCAICAASAACHTRKTLLSPPKFLTTRDEPPS